MSEVSFSSPLKVQRTIPSCDYSANPIYLPRTGRFYRAKLAANLLGRQLPSSTRPETEIRSKRHVLLPPMRGLRALHRD